MKKRSPLNLFIVGFIKSFFIIVILFGVGFGTYRLTKLYYTVADVPDHANVDKFISDIVNDVQVDDISKNLIYGVDEETGRINHLVLEVFSTYTGNLDYITIPVETQYTMSNDMFQKLCVVNPETPQIITLSEIYRYFPEKSLYDYGVILIEDYLGIDISYYTALKEKDFNHIFEAEEHMVTTKGTMSDSTNQNNSDTNLPISGTLEEKRDILVLSADFLNEVKGISTEEEIDQYIEEIYKKLESNLPAKSKKKYVDAYLKVRPDYIYYHCLYGMTENKVFTVDVETSYDLIKDIENHGEYDVVQEEQQLEENVQNVGVSSAGLNIRILNGSKITGLAATYQTRLTTDGYTVAGINNYDSELVGTTKIIVKSEGMGLDLAKYFNEPIIEIGAVPDGTDIQIILGTADRID